MHVVCPRAARGRDAAVQPLVRADARADAVGAVPVGAAPVEAQAPAAVAEQCRVRAGQGPVEPRLHLDLPRVGAVH